MEVEILNKLYKTGNLNIKLLYKLFKEIIEKWIKDYSIDSYCNYRFKKGKNKDNLCLRKVIGNKRCKEHNLNYKKCISYIKNNNINSLLIDNRYIEKESLVPSCPSYDDLYPPMKPNEKYYNKISKKNIKIIVPLKLLNYNNFIYDNNKKIIKNIRKLNSNNIIKMDDKKEPSVLLKQNLKIADYNKLAYDCDNNNNKDIYQLYIRGYNINKKIINLRLKNNYIVNNKTIFKLLKYIKM